MRILVCDGLEKAGVDIAVVQQSPVVESLTANGEIIYDQTHLAHLANRAAGTVYPAGTASGTTLTVVIGAVAYALFAYWLHGWLFGVRPLP